MFDLAATDGSVRRKEMKSPVPAGDVRVERAITGNKLDSGSMVAIHHRLLDLFTRESDRQLPNRIQMAHDEDMYDNDQWPEDDAQTLRDRGQTPLVYNVISASVDWVLGTEKRSRADFKILPRRKEDSKPAERKTQLLKYLSDVNRTPFDVSRAFEDSVKVGVGWVEDGYEDSDLEEPLYSRYESWRNILWDSAATEMDLSDARYTFRHKWLDLDIACAMFPKRKALLERAAVDADNFLGMDAYGDEVLDQQEMELEQNSNGRSDNITGYQRRRIRVIEGWLRMPAKADKLTGGVFSGEIYDPYSPGHREDVESGSAEVVNKVTMRMNVAIFTTAGMLWYSPSPYRHNRFPFTPIWGKRRGRNGMPYGMIRGLKDIQIDVNKRASKALHILSTNKTIMDEGAVDDIDEFIEEVARPDAVIVKKTGKEITLNADRGLEQGHLDMMARSISLIQSASGVTDENLGRQTNARSGIAIERRQDQGSLTSSKYFDNLRLASQIRGEKQLANVEQFMSEPKAFRITNMRGQPEYINVNDGLPENDIVRSKADFIISDEDWRATVRQAQTEALLELLMKLAPGAPQLAMVMLDLIVESMDIPQREELVKRIRQVTGMRDPDAEELTPEEQAKQQAQAQNDQMQQAMMQAELDKATATAAKTKADAELAAAKVLELAAKIASTNVTSQQNALNAATSAIALPAATHVADHILHESGFKSRTEQEETLAQVVGIAQQQQAAQAQQAPPQPPQDPRFGLAPA